MVVVFILLKVGKQNSCQVFGCVELKALEQEIARGRNDTQNTAGNNNIFYSVQTFYDLSNINDLIIKTRGQEERRVTQQK